ncbi:MAG: adenylate/guanylate cyclase domain-containing protein [Saprospiraceae bacterium]
MKPIMLLIFIAFVNYSFSRDRPPKKQVELDSLWTIWKNTNESDSVRAASYYEFIKILDLLSEFDNVLANSDTLLNFSTQKNYKPGIGYAYVNKGAAYHLINSDSSRFYWSKASDIFKELNMITEYGEVNVDLGISYSSDNRYLDAIEKFEMVISTPKIASKDKVYAYRMMSSIFRSMGEVQKALEYSLANREILKKGKKTGLVGWNLLSIGHDYINLGDTSKGMDYQFQALKFFKDNNSNRGNWETLHAIANEYREQGKYDLALDYLDQALTYYLKEYDWGFTIPYDIAKTHYQKGDIDKAKQILDKLIKVTLKEESYRILCSSYSLLGEIYEKEKNYKMAVQLCLNSYNYSLKVENWEFQKRSCECLYNNYKKLNNSKLAWVYLEKKLVIEDSLNVLETNKRLMRFDFKEKAKKDSLATLKKERLVQEAHKTAIQQKEKTRNMAIGAGIFFLLMAGGLYWRWQFTKKAKAIIEKEKDRSENLLLNILPAEVAEELKLKGEAQARDYDLVSILFTDFKSFTLESEKMDATTLVKEINICFKAFDEICEKYNIEKIKTIGDAYMAAGGLPVPEDESIKNTVLAALEMQAFIVNQFIEKEASGEHAFQMRVGIHTGPVVAGIVGVKKFQYDIWGDTVNTASRIESNGEVGKVNISEATYELLKNDSDFSFESRGKIEAKGKGEINMYFVSLV